jgi:hypothetical protein
MFGSNSIKLNKELMEKIKVAAEIMGCASVNEFIETILSGEVDKILSQTAAKSASSKEVEDITNKLKGLGYLE